MIHVDDVEAFVSFLEPTPARSLGVFEPRHRSVFNPTPSPGDDFDADNLIESLLVADGHAPCGTTTGDGITYTRAGKDPRDGPSMTAFPARNLVHVHSTSVPGLDAGRTYGPFNYLAATRFGGDHSAAARSLVSDARSGDGANRQDSDPTGLTLIIWTELDEREEAIVEGVAHPGRWTAVAGPAKSGKSEFLLNVALHIADGVDPFDRTPLPAPAVVLWCDAEMGRLDLAERIEAHGFTPTTLERFHATDLVPLLDTPTGAAHLLATVDTLDVNSVFIDGINGTISGAEKDDEPWRALFFHTIAALKRRGVAVITADNLGKDTSLGPRGSSVKLDKPDAVVQLSRTDNGTRLKATHRRSAAYPADVTYTVTGLDGTTPIRYQRHGDAWPAGTREAANRLDELDAPVDISRRKAGALIRDAGHSVSTETLGAAIKYRKRSGPLPIPTPGDRWTTTHHPAPDQSPGPPVEKPSDQGGPPSGPVRTTTQTVVRNPGECDYVTPRTGTAAEDRTLPHLDLGPFGRELEEH